MSTKKIFQWTTKKVSDRLYSLILCGIHPSIVFWAISIEKNLINIWARVGFPTVYWSSQVSHCADVSSPGVDGPHGAVYPSYDLQDDP